MLILHNGTDCEELLSNTAFLGKIVVDVQRHDREGLPAIAWLPTKAAFETTPCITHPDSPSVLVFFSEVRVT